MNWKEIKDQKDIEELFNVYGGFHDSCIVNLYYESGAGVNREKSMYFGGASNRQLCVTFQRQWDPITIELCFSGLRRLHLVGWQDNYFCDVTSAYLAFHERLLLGNPSKVIVWADTDWFNVEKVATSNALVEPADTYIVSNYLKWRILNE